MISCLKVFIFLCEQGISFIIYLKIGQQRGVFFFQFVFFMLWNGYFLDLDQYPQHYLRPCQYLKLTLTLGPSLLGNAPNQLIGCIIQKRYIYHTYLKIFQPDNWKGSEHCMEMLHTGKWNDQNCQRTRQVLCEKFID